MPAFDEVTPAAPFVEGTHPGAYAGTQYVPAPAEQVQVVPAETGGYKGAGGVTRLSIRDRVVAARPYKSEFLPVEDWDATVEVRSLPLGERNDMMASIIDEETGKGDFKAMFPALLIAAVYDPETGEKVFAPDDAAVINGLDSGVVDAVAEVALRLSGLSDKAKDDVAGKSSKTATSV